jgi:hypothetical protein
MSLNTGSNISHPQHRIGNPLENEMPESSDPEHNIAEPLINDSTPPPSDTNGDEMPDVDDLGSDLPDPWYFEQTMQSQCPAPSPSPTSQGIHLVDQSTTPMIQLDTENLPSPSGTPHVEPPSRVWHICKTRRFDLGVCECSYEVSKSEIEMGDTVMQCKVPGCETIWVGRHENNYLRC